MFMHLESANQDLQAASAASPSKLPLKIEYVSPGKLTVTERNARTHSNKQKRALTAAMKRFGFVVPVLVDAESRIIAGHCRVEVAKGMGLEAIPIVRVSHLSESERRALVIADNRLAELAEWDRDLLAEELKDLLEIDFELGTEAIGFEVPELDLILEGAAEKQASGPEDRIPAADFEARPVARRGDLWLLGCHRVVCGDARTDTAYQALLGDERVDLVFQDPPWNVSAAHIGGCGQIQHADFAFAAGEMSESEFIDFLVEAMGLALAYSRDGAMHYVCMDDLHSFELLAAARRIGLSHKVTCVWAKTNGGLGGTYRKQCEFVHVFKFGTGPHVNNVELGRHGRNRTTLWSYAGVNSFRKGRMEDLEAHPTIKPVALVADAIKDASRPKDIVLDPFLGSGTTILAAEKTGRRGRGIEYEPAYVDVIIRRWQEFTGRGAIHAETGLTFEDREDERRLLVPSASSGRELEVEGA